MEASVSRSALLSTTPCESKIVLASIFYYRVTLRLDQCLGLYIT